MKFKLKGLPKNRKWFEVKKRFFQFGYITDFYYRNDGTANITFEKLNNKQQFYDYCETNNIEILEQNNSNNKSNNQTRNNNNVKQIHNPSFYYYKDKSYGKNIESFIWSNKYNNLLKIENADSSLKLKTVYPGLLIGSGYNHPIKKGDEEAYQLGFFFDHTTGLPLITGTSIKGAIRSLFKDDEKFNCIKEVYSIKEDKESMITRLFESGNIIFYDAYIIDTDNKDENGNKIIFGSDYITPHNIDEPFGEFRDPNPIKFLKVLPGVTWQFQFKANKDDIELFKKIILDFGLGAKTNVGYGQFRE